MHETTDNLTRRDRWRQRRMAMEARRERSTPKGLRSELPWTGLLPHWLGSMATRMLPRGRANALNIRLVPVEIRPPRLPPALDGFSILHLSDPHPSSLDGLMERAADLLAGVSADIAVVTGDFQLLGRPSADATAEALRPMLGALDVRLGTVAVLGNHDSHDMADALEGLGVRVLIDEHLVLDRGDARVVLTGTDDVHRFYSEAAVEALHAAPEGFRVALVHSPDLAEAAAAAGHDLYLCGHTHGGQICLPGGVPVVTATDAPRRLAAGAWSVDGMIGHTTRGVGVGRPSLRYNCPGEIARIVLRSASR